MSDDAKRVLRIVSPTAKVVQVGQPGPPGGGSSTPLVQQLVQWALSGAYQTPTITRGSGEQVTSASVLWPDGSTGTLTPTGYSSTYDAYSGYTLTHNASGKTITQPAVTRDSSGSVTAAPALQVTP